MECTTWCKDRHDGDGRCVITRRVGDAFGASLDGTVEVDGEEAYVSQVITLDGSLYDLADVDKAIAKLTELRALMAEAEK